MDRKKLKIGAYFIPKEVCMAHNPVCILIDAVRASCTIATFFDKKAESVILIEDEYSYFKNHPEAAQNPYCLSAEKKDGSRAELAEVSPSLIELETKPSYTGKHVLFRTTNGTVGVRTLSELGAEDILIGSMLNCDAVAKTAVDLAIKKNTEVCTVCAGREDGRIYCIDDTYCSGVLISRMKAYAETIGLEPELQDAAKIACGMQKLYKNAEEAYRCSGTGEIMRRLRQEEDLVLCARYNVMNVVPYMDKVNEDGSIALCI